MNGRKPLPEARLLLLFLCGCALIGPTAAGEGMQEPGSLGLGYRRMYSLDFETAEKIFTDWEQRHPEDPLGPASEAARLLFSELNRLGILEAQFFVEDSSFLRRQTMRADPEVRERFDAALHRAETRARERLRTNALDADSLFSLALVSGLQADWTSLIENRNLAALAPTRRASQWAAKLLSAFPDYGDAYLATGMAKYVIGSTPWPARWLLRIGGYPADKQEGIRELEITAEHGRYLAPFASLLLAIAHLREGDVRRARQLLVGLREQFSENPLFDREIVRIDTGRAQR